MCTYVEGVAIPEVGFSILPPLMQGHVLCSQAAQQLQNLCNHFIHLRSTSTLEDQMPQDLRHGITSCTYHCCSGA